MNAEAITVDVKALRSLITELDMKALTSLVAELCTHWLPVLAESSTIIITDGPPAKQCHVMERNATPGPSGVPHPPVPDASPVMLPAVHFPVIPATLQSAMANSDGTPMHSHAVVAPSLAAPMQLVSAPMAPVATTWQSLNAPAPPRTAPLPASFTSSPQGRGHGKQHQGQKAHGGTLVCLGPLAWGTDVRGEFASLKALMPNNYRLPDPFDVGQDECAGQGQFALLWFRNKNEAHKFVSIWGLLRTGQYKKVNAEVILRCMPPMLPSPDPMSDPAPQSGCHIRCGMEDSSLERGKGVASARHCMYYNTQWHPMTPVLDAKCAPHPGCAQDGGVTLLVKSWNICSNLAVGLTHPGFLHSLQQYDVNLFQELHLMPGQEECLPLPPGYSVWAISRSPCKEFTGRQWGGVAAIACHSLPITLNDTLSGPDLKVLDCADFCHPCIYIA
jgi:hypothetical protein